MAYLAGTRFFEDLKVGESYLSPGRTVTESDVVAFAGLSGDYNQLHTDAEFMRDSIFGARIAHGLLGLAIQSGLGIRVAAPPIAVIAFLGIKEWNFRRPILLGDTIRLRLMLAEKKETSKPSQGIITQKREVINQRDEVVQDGIQVLMVARKPKGEMN